MILISNIVTATKSKTNIIIELQILFAFHWYASWKCSLHTDWLCFTYKVEMYNSLKWWEDKQSAVALLVVVTSTSSKDIRGNV